MTDNTIQTNENQTKRSVGRPKASIVWPEGGFTIESLKTATGLSEVTLYNKVGEAIEKGQIKESGKEPNFKGRPRIVYSKTTNGVASNHEATVTAAS